ncbi:helix-turn-helix transcriptional regulator [candidate division KSB1 bacterium]|nr:helix-turn-helix transcriptional regulator [candidate division KSB1 bacterium]NIR70821.1 helix-turn-helix transcriptional regulator [candidate division KSB1 bacterium]NIS27833.1 helix-turn-helix transcriptional regulator [candidate division KSB1 bacterium]NIT74715.1 helix-turn-helix transcriptional regulator [candidate division KSB1 bacterium]NIU28498.1 helix-turn-helix transcriptional regulator [candidate division KSB1 bacterium]
MPELSTETCIRKNVDVPLLQRLQKQLLQKDNLEKLADLLTVAGNETRLKILYLLSQSSELCVCDLADITGMTVSSISHQLSKLRAYGFIGKRREGQTIFYRLLDTPFVEILKQLFILED